MRILFLTHYFHPEANAPARRVYELTRRWAAAGEEVTVVTGVPNVPRGVPYPGYRNRLCYREEVDGVRVIRVWTYLAPNRGVLRRSLNYASFLLSGGVAAAATGPAPDVVVATTPQLLCALAGHIVAGVRGAPFVLDLRDIWPASIAAVGALRRGWLLDRLGGLERRLYRTADHIVAVGDGYARAVVAAGIPQEKVSVIPNGVDTAKFAPRPCRPPDRARFGLPEKAFVCLYAGTVGMACGLDVVLKAAEIMQRRGETGVLFVIAGDGARWEELRDEAERRRLSNVRFTGRVPGDAVPALIACADVCLVHLVRRDLFRTVLPSKMFEAAAMARPLLVGVEGEAARWVATAGAGLAFEPENAAGLVAALDRLRGSGDLRREMGKRGRMYVAREHDYDRLAERYRRVLYRMQEETDEAQAGE